MAGRSAGHRPPRNRRSEIRLRDAVRTVVRGTSRIRRRSDGPARRVRPDHGRLFRLRNHARNALDAAGSLHPRRTVRRVLRPAQVRQAGALAPCVPRIRPLPEGLPHALLRRRHGPLQIAGSLRRRPFRGRMGRLRQRGHATRSQTARRDQTYARPYLVDAGNQVAAQPQQQNPQRTLYYLYKRAARMGPRAGLLSRRQPDAPRGLRLRGRIRVRRRRIPQTADDARRHHRQGQSRNLRLRHSAVAARPLRIEELRPLGHGDRRPQDRAGLLPGDEPHHGRQLRFAGRQRRRRTGGHQFRPHVAFDDERPAIRPRDLPQYRRRHPLRALHDRPHRRKP